MAKQEVNIGTEGNDATGDSIRESFRKVNENFTELYAVFGVGGQINFTTLSDTPDTLEQNRIIMTNTAGTAVVQNVLVSNSALDNTKADTISFDYSVAGKLVISTAFTQLSDDLSPSLGGGLNAAGKAIAGVTVSDQAAENLNNDHDGDTSYTIDDLVITRGYADRRYIGAGLPIRVAGEPANRDAFVLTILRYDLGDLEFATAHGFDSGINGTAYKFNAEDTAPTNLVSGTTYYIRFKSNVKLSLFANQNDASQESDTTAESQKINVSGTIASDDVHTITDAGFDSTLTGNFLSDVAVPRSGVTRRQGDTMTGALILHDHPGDLSGSGTPNGAEDLQAASKFYVDNTAYSSPEVLFVSTKGDDSMAGVPSGKEGSSFTYAFKSINAAAQRAEDMIRTARPEPGPYMQTMTYDETVEADVTQADVENPLYEQTRFLLNQNKLFLQKEITGFLAYTYPTFVYDIARCELDLGLILDSIALDINRGATANYLTKLAAQNYYSSISGRIAITAQATETIASINKARDLVASVLLNENFQAKTIGAITKKSGDTPALVTTTTNHGLANKNIVVFDKIVGMTQIENVKAYVKVITDQTFEIFSDSALTTPYDNSTFTNFATSADPLKNQLGLRWQIGEDQYFAPASEDSALGGDADAVGRTSVTTLFNLVVNIISNGIDAGADVAFGSRYQIQVNNGTNTSLDQSDPTNTDTLPGKIIRGKRSGALMQITEFTNATGTTTFFGNLQFPKDFEVGEPLEYGNFVKRKQITIRVESGQYEEDYPIRLSNNVSLKGDEFRRVIIRPKDRISQSKYAKTYFFRDKEFDGLTLATDGVPFFNQSNKLQGFFGYHYLKNPKFPIDIDNAGAISQTNAGNFTTAASIMVQNKDYIIEETIKFVKDRFPQLALKETKCRRDTGLIVDAIIKDLRAGGMENVLESQGEYFDPYSALGDDSSQITPTEAAIGNIASLSAQLLAGQAPTYTVQTAAFTPTGATYNSSTGDMEITIGSHNLTTSNSVEIIENGITFTCSQDGGSSQHAYPRKVSVTSSPNSDPAYEKKLQIQSTTPTSITVNVGASPAGQQYSHSFVSALSSAVTINEYTAGSDAVLAIEKPDISLGNGESGTVAIVGAMIDLIEFAFNVNFNPPQRNEEMDVFLMSDATIVRNITVQGHGGFMCVLDPEGQILTKSPYIQTASSFSRSLDEKTFSGGMYVDAYVGNLPTRIISKQNAYKVTVQSQDVDGQKQGLKLRLPDLPAPFYVDGRRFQINAVSDYDSALGTAIIYLDPTSNNGTGYDESQFDTNPGVVARDIFIQSGGNRSMLANDFTQINDLGYGLVVNNAAFSEQVSTFTYYCHTAMYANNGSEIRGLNCSNGYGNFGLVAEGADPNEIPDRIVLRDDMVQPAKAFSDGTSLNQVDDTSIHVYNLDKPPTASSLITIRQTVGSSLVNLNYKISSVVNLSDSDNDGTKGVRANGDIRVRGVKALTNVQSTLNADAAAAATYTDVAVTGGIGEGLKITIQRLANGTVSVASLTANITNCGVGYNTTTGGALSIAASLLGGGTGSVTLDIGTIYPGDVFGASGFSDIRHDIYKLDIVADDVSKTDFYSAVQEAIPDGDFLEYRNEFNHILDLVQNPTALVTRPSTAINFDESDYATYRSVAFTATDAFSNAIASDEIMSTFEVGFDFVQVAVDLTRVTGAAPTGSGTLGNAIGDEYLAIQEITSTRDAQRLTRDSEGRQPGNAGYTHGMVFAHEGKLHRIIDLQNDSSVSFIRFEDVPGSRIRTGTQTGLEAPLNFEKNLECGLAAGGKGEITIAISLLRATGHDFTQIGTGSFNDSNYPNVILGDPENSLAGFYTDAETATSSQVWERKKGRVFFVSTDQNGFFRVGKFFSVDQATGDITFAGEIGLSNANSLGFKRGVTINEFSADDSFADESGQAVPTEKAVASYISRRLGYSTAGSQIDASGNRIGPGFLALNGTTNMEGNLDVGGNKIENLANPTAGNDATTKNYVDDNTAAFAELELLRDLEINTPAEKDLLVFTGKKIIYTNPETGGTIANGDTISGTASGAQGTVVDISSVTDEILGAQRKIVYTPTVGTINTGTDTISNGTAVATILTASPATTDEIANASEAAGSDATVNVTRPAGKASYDIQINPDTIVNADVNSAAGIVQSKLAMRIADTSASAPGSADQSVLGLARFDSDDFSVTNGWVTLATNNVDFADLPQLTQNEVFARTNAGTGNISAITMSDVVANGGGITDNDISSELAYGSPRNDPGAVVVATGTPGTSGTYKHSVISYTSTGNTLAKRNDSGNIMANALILGGTETNIVMDVSSTDVRVKTPGGKIVLQSGGASGSADNTISTKLPTSIDNGTTGITVESDLQNGATNLNDRPFIATEYVYSNMIESHGTISTGKPGGGAAIGLGADPGFTNSGTNVITFATGGTERAYINNSNFVVSNTFIANGNIQLGNVASSDNLTITARVDSHIVPDSNTTYDLGSSTLKWNVLYGKATSAQYADLAENYLSDKDYEPGTILVFGGEQEVTTTNTKGDTRVAGVVSEHPAHLMNSNLEGDHVLAVALTGRVPTKVLGRVKKGDMLVTSAVEGYAIVNPLANTGTVIGKALQDKDTDDKGVIEVVVGRV
tara:strand:+ start:1369 stop:9261 length:7893 start_codon:yes stop_codon:yes gene_type:complete